MGIEVSGGRDAAMANAMTTSVVRQIETLLVGGSVAGLSDGQLIERFVAGRDPLAAEAAFAAIVARHGPMVLGLCRQLLGDHQHAEDAFQAVFLVLARRARSLRDPDLLGPWLYGVALRTARKARSRRARIRPTEEALARNRPEASAAIRAEQVAIDREQAEALHAEIDRLPASSRLPVVLCYFEGLSLAEAAQRLRCPAGTVHSRLVRAREKLRRGLLRRGVVLSGAALTSALVPRSASASIPPLLCDSTTRAAIAFAARHAAVGGALSAPADRMAREVLKNMLIHKLKAAVLPMLLLATVAAVAGSHALSAFAGPREGGRPGEPIAKGARAEPRPADSPRPAPGRMFIDGRVVAPDGKPVSGAVVDVVTRFRSPVVGTDDDSRPWLSLVGRGQSDGDGRYHLDAPRTASSRVFVVNAIAAAPGYGLGWAELDPDADRPAAEIRLRPAQTLRVRLVDVSGAPAANVEVNLMSIGRRDEGGSFDGVRISGLPPAGIRAWPRPFTTDDQGRITLTGIGRGLDVTLDVRDVRYARQEPRIDAARLSTAGEITVALEPARIIAGRVLAADTGGPIPDAVVAIGAGRGPRTGLRFTRFRADDQGRFTANPSPGEYFRMHAFAPDGRPYLVPQLEFAWSKGAVRKELEIRMPFGVLIRGKVTDATIGRPLPGSSVQYIPVAARGDNTILSGSQSKVASRTDGSFQVAVPPGKGHLLVFGPTDDYVLDTIGSNALTRDLPGGLRFRAHAVIPYEVKAGDPPRDVTASLRPGATIRGRLEGPDGRPVTEAFIITTLNIDANNPLWHSFSQTPVRDGRFELRGLDPRGVTRIHVLDAGHEWGATVELSGKRAGEDLAIRLQPCGRARGRFVGPGGRPVAEPRAMFEFVATPGPSSMSRNKRDRAELAADVDFLANVDRKHYRDDPSVDAEGRFTMPSLIPGALYRISDWSTVNVAEKGAQIRKDFTVKPGETLDLGDVLIEKPR
jgi:RNA polymerase sigma factor (sigma-70 family)